jgi:hypothetical protein
VSLGNDTASKLKLLSNNMDTAPARPPESNMKINIRKYSKERRPTEITIGGGIFNSDVDLLNSYLEKVARTRCREVVIDMRNLYFICYEAVKALSYYVKEMTWSFTLVKIKGMCDEIKSFLVDINEYDLLAPVYHEGSWRRIEYQPGVELNAMVASGRNSFDRASAGCAANNLYAASQQPMYLRK